MASNESVRKDIISQINRIGGFSVFWACDNEHRARMLDKMVADGELIYHKKAPFPWIPAQFKQKDSNEIIEYNGRSFARKAKDTHGE